MGLQQLLDDLFGRDLPIAIECYDGSRIGPAEPPATVRINSPGGRPPHRHRPRERVGLRPRICRR
jgi:hypothetical protein